MYILRLESFLGQPQASTILGFLLSLPQLHFKLEPTSIRMYLIFTHLYLSTMVFERQLLG